MKRLTAILLAGMMAGSGALASADPASAQNRPFDRAERDRYVGSYCDRNPRSRDCRDWRVNRSRWDDRRYRDWYRRHHRSNDNAAAAIFGLGVGALLGATVPNALSGGRDVTGHVQRCAARYRSYDPRTNTYLGYDGYRHPCRL